MVGGWLGCWSGGWRRWNDGVVLFILVNGSLFTCYCSMSDCLYCIFIAIALLLFWIVSCRVLASLGPLCVSLLLFRD